MAIEELKELLDDAIWHLEYCGYGDSWERECAEDLIRRVKEYTQQKNKK